MKIAAAVLLGLAQIVKTSELPSEPEFVQSKVVQEEYAEELAQIDDSLTEKEKAQILKMPKTFEDLYEEVDQDDTCEWEDDGSRMGKERKGWMKVDGGVCRVFTRPASPYPATLKTWKERRAWRKANPTAWKAYIQAWRDARNNAKFYYPYNAAKCNEVKGRRSSYMIVAKRSVLKKEKKFCPLKYPEEESESDDDDDNNDDDNNDNDDNDNNDNDDNDNNDNDDKGTDTYGSGDVPDPKKEKL